MPTSDPHFENLGFQIWFSSQPHPLPAELRLSFCKKEFGGGITAPHLRDGSIFRFSRDVLSVPTPPHSSLLQVCWLSVPFSLLLSLFSILPPLLFSFFPSSHTLRLSLSLSRVALTMDIGLPVSGNPSRGLGGNSTHANLRVIY